ncbi:molybdate ABC transporter substrate-binding protein [Psychromarinibacter sp. C21-152]|uniref:Molybdate ABC transporter substrate-binding protein n=1 Tax=Psychromarinibacter sediminicola TaxID=3033385 RepID=A0AAE3NRT7_9RHOB|nr:molybdate ABC transporter substrate-binding protein [Psychromarinibacter sediminicola]MDF0599357.1 molybdate ABC transporter substrate-binding protein [Psychromarinibacter sediminicola]
MRILPVILALFALAVPARADRITVFAAASLKTALDEIVAGFEAETGHDVALSFAGSSALARQIGLGAPADIFISANTDWMDTLAADGHIASGTRVELLSNRLVLIRHWADAPQAEAGPPDIAGLLGDGRLAMALVEAVPAGIYGKAALQSLGQWDKLADRVAQADNVRAALALVALGEAPYGIVYATDAAAEPDVTAVYTFPADSHPPITYPAALIAGRKTPAATAFLDHLQTDAARAVFRAQGFIVPD